ncbi:MAG: GNAT family N-acetyltransferase [Planctomycetes bacterium]|nr:GNAT family N-acetyltransferase [Planctomycetota bacterium]
MPDFEIAILTEADVPSLLELADANYEEQLVFDPDFKLRPQWRTYYERIVRGSIENDLYTLFVARTENRMIGFLAALLATDPTWEDNPRATIVDLFVSPEFRRRGVGDRLFAAAKEHSVRHGAKMIMLNVFAGNDAGKKFWRKHGFDVFMERHKLKISSV